MSSNSVDSVQRLQDTMQALCRISAEVGSVDALMRRIVDEVMRFCDATGAVVELAEGDEMVYVCCAGSIAGFVGLRLPLAGSLSGLCVRSRQVQRCADSESDARVHRDACRQVQARSMLLVPLPYADAVVGVLKATSDQAAAFSDQDEQLLSFGASIIGAALGRELALERHRRHSAELTAALDASRSSAQQLETEALTDALTGLPNRRAFERGIAAFLAGSPAPGSAALCFVDLKRFKDVNDRHGHEAGDAALRRIADCLRATARADDLAARIAGDEFVVLLRGLGTDPAAACHWFARKLVSAVEHAPLHHAGSRIALGVSIGLAIYDSRGLDRARWLANADAAMYAAKDAGMNAYRLYGDEDLRAAGRSA